MWFMHFAAMTSDRWLVLILGSGLIVAVNWFFLFSRRSVTTAARVEGGQSAAQEVRIVVKGGYSPSVVRAVVGVPLRLVFDRQETSGCSEEVVIPAFSVRKFLPPFQQTTVEIIPKETGEFEFTCGMSMLRGRLVVEADTGSEKR